MNALLDSAVCPQLVLTLGHFVWQGLAVGGLAWLAGVALRRCSSSARYRLYVAALLVMAACPVATFLWLNHEPTLEAAEERSPLVGIESAELFPRPASTAAEEIAVAVDGSTPIAAAASEERFDLSLAPAPSEASRTDWRRFAPWLTAVYLAGVLAMLVRLALGLRGGRELRRRSEPVADPALLELLTGRAVALGLRSVPVLAWCREIAVPTVVGVLRPTILLPMSLTTGMTPDQLAAILTHELAHIRRWDPLVNVFQRVVEAVLFFHPMVWFVSRRIRQERENCCDDLVLATGTDPVGYASSLLDIVERAAEERRQGVPALATLRADGRTSELGGRIHRVLGAERHEAIRLNRPGLVLMLAVALLALAGLSRLAVNAEEEIETDAPAEVMAEDEQAAWRELEATGLPIYGDAARWQSQRRWLATLERMNYPASEQARIRGQLDEPVRSAELWRVPPQAWPLIGRLESLHDLGIIASDVGEEALRHVARLPNLRRIRLTNSNLLPTDAAALKAATPLEQIEIIFTDFDVPAARRQELLGELTEAEQAWAEEYLMRHSGREHNIEAAILTDRMLEAFRDLPHLRTLRLVNTPVSGRGVEAIGDHEALEELDVSIVDFPPDAARAIGRLTRLRKFRTTADGVTDETLAAFSGLVHLEELELWAGNVTDVGVRQLARLKSLRKLALRGSSITDAGLLELAALPQLERLVLSLAKGELTADGLARFQSLKPECEVITDAAQKEIPPGTEQNAADGEATDADGASSAVAPPDEPQSNRDEFAEAVAARVVGHLPFLSDAHRQQTAAEFRELVQKYGPEQPTPEFVRTILDALGRHLQRDFPEGPNVDDPVRRDQRYVALPGSVRMLQWRLFMALQRQPLDEGQQARLAEQNAWFRDYIQSLPKPPEGHVRGHAEALADFQAKIDDPLSPMFKEPLSDAQFAACQNSIREQAQAHGDIAVVVIVGPILHASLQVRYARSSEIPVPRLETFDERPTGFGAGTNGIGLMFPSSSAFAGLNSSFTPFGSQFLSLAPQPTMPSASIGFSGKTPDELDEWFREHEQRGHLTFDKEKKQWFGVRGTRLVPIPQRHFFEADQIAAGQLAEQVRKEGSRLWKLPEPVSRDSFGTERYNNMAAVLTPEGRLFLLKLHEQSLSGLHFHIRQHHPQAARGRVAASITAGANDIGTIRVNPELFEKQDGNLGLEPTVLKVLEADGSPARSFNGVVRAHVGYQEPLPKIWWSERRRDGSVSLAGLAAGTHWLVIAPDSWNRTPLKLEVPPAEPEIQRRLRPDRHWRSTNLVLTASVHAAEQGGVVIRVRIENNTDERLRIGDQDLCLEAGTSRSQSGVLSPEWRKEDAAAFSETTIEPGQTGQIELHWPEWLRHGLWFDYGGLPVRRAGPTLPDPEPGKISVRVWVRTHGVLPVSVTHPSLMNLPVRGNAAEDNGLIERARVVPLDDIQMTAQQAGLLASLEVAEGAKVKKGDLLAVFQNHEAPNRLEMIAPFRGEVVKVFRRAGDMIQPGQPVVRLVRRDRILVRGDFNLAGIVPAEILGKKAEALPDLDVRGEIPLPGKVTFISPQADANGNYHVWIEVNNREQDGKWLLVPGQTAKLRILGDESGLSTMKMQRDLIPPAQVPKTGV